MAIYKRGENWYIDFRFKGQRVRESIGPSRRDAEKVIAKRKTEIVENKYLDIRKEPNPVTFHAFAKEYLQWAKANKKPSTWDSDISKMRRLDKEFGERIFQQITAWQIEKWKSSRKERVKPATVNRELALLKHMYSKAIEWGKCKEHPAKKVKLLKGEVKRIRFLMPDQIQELISNCMDHLKPVVTIAVHTGMRRSEILGLRRDQVDYDQEIISILDTKNHERRDIPMNETVKVTLKAIEDNGPYFFCDKDGKKFTKLQHSFQNAVKKSGIEDFRFHDLRHCFASNLVMAGEDLNTVAELLGHKGLEMTRRYAHLSPKFKKKAVNVLDRLMSQNSPQPEMTQKVVSITR